MAEDYIGSYRLLKLVRAGNSCQIWEAMRDDNTRCALKALQEEHRKNKEEIGYLKHEFNVGRTLSHPNVIEIYDFNIVRGIPHLALEYFKSKNLKQALRADTKFVQKHAQTIIEQAATALSHLNSQGWIHRDVKPDNLLVDGTPTVKLIDFAISEKVKTGLGKIFGGKSKVQGTRSYMSPEQIRGESLDTRSDLYSFGCVIFEMFGGRPPFTGGSANELLQKHLKAPVPSLAAAASVKVAPKLASLVAKMMSKKREERPASFDEFLEEFQSLRSLVAR